MIVPPVALTGAKVIQLAGRSPLTFKRRELPVRRCQHMALTVDPKTQTTECDACGQHFEPFAALLHIVDYAEHFVDAANHYERERDRLEGERDALVREIANLKAQKRRAEKP